MADDAEHTPDASGAQDTIRHEAEEQSVTKATRLSARLIYEVIRRDGEEELERPVLSLIWSAIAAGILISFSVLAEAILRLHLPPASWSYLLENLGYSLGFVIVIFGRMQLFTENTITTVLPALARPTADCVWRVTRLWIVVLLANVAGAMTAAGFLVFTNLLPIELAQVLEDLSRHAMRFNPAEAFVAAVPAGVILAAIVWMMPSAEGNAFFIVVTFTWLIAAGDFAHIVAGSVEMGYLLWTGDLGLWPALSRFFLPVLAGNVVGGTAIFTLLAWGQVKREVAHEAVAETERGTS